MKNIDSNFGGDVGKIKGVNFERSESVPINGQIYSAPQKEISNLDNAHSALVGRSMVKKMCDEVLKTEPWLKKHLVPKCERLGFCDEDKSCGRMPQKS